MLFFSVLYKYNNKKERHIMKTKTIQNKLLQFISDEIDGQDYETVANLIKGNQFIAAANFIDMLDTSPRNHMEDIIQKQPSLYNEMFSEQTGVYSEFALEGLEEGGY